MFHVGQMVVCVDDTMDGGHVPWRVDLKSARGTWVQSGRVYTISGFDEYYGVKTLHLEEATNISTGRYWPDGVELGFAMSRFRPVRQTSIEQFTSILNQAPQREDA